MIKTLTWISPSRAALIVAILTFVVMVAFSIIGMLFGGVVRFWMGGPSGGLMMGIGATIVGWILVPGLTYVFTFLYCVLFNFVTGKFGGIPIRLDEAD